MTYDTLDLSVDGRGVARLVLNRPDKHNAMNAQMIADLTHAAQKLGQDGSVRVVVLAAAGRSFCAGGDLGWMQDQMAADAATRAREAGHLAQMLQALNRLPKPLIGALQGNAFGGGVGLACICDVAIGVTGIKLGLTEVRLGLIPATIGPYVLARMGEAAARRVFFSGRLFGASEARDLGLLADVVAPEDLEAAIEAQVAPYLSAAPGAVAAAKALALRLGGAVSQEMIDDSIAALVRQWETDEADAGIAAFFNKTPPPWSV